MQLLHIDSSVLGIHSASRALSAEIVARQVTLHPGIQLTYRDLAADAALHLSPAHLAAWQGGAVEDSVLGADLAKGGVYLEELFAADIIVVGSPMYNFSIPSQLKAWIDRVVISGKTFKYGAQGAEGLAGNKRVIVAISRGGFYGAGTPTAVGEHLETYLRWVFGFIGVTNPEFISADGVGVGPEHREKALAGALQAATNLQAV